MQFVETRLNQWNLEKALSRLQQYDSEGQQTLFILLLEWE